MVLFAAAEILNLGFSNSSSYERPPAGFSLEADAPLQGRTLSGTGRF